MTLPAGTSSRAVERGIFATMQCYSSAQLHRGMYIDKARQRAYDSLRANAFRSLLALKRKQFGPFYSLGRKTWNSRRPRTGTTSCSGSLR